MKYFYVIILILSINICNLNAQNQSVTDKEWNTLIQELQNEKWSSAEKLSLNYLKRFSENDDSTTAPAVLRYMYLRSVAAKLSEKQYSKEVTLKLVKKFTGKFIATPPKEFIPKGMFNCFTLNDDSTQLYSCSSNKNMTYIQIFEYYQMSHPEEIKSAKAGEFNHKNLRIIARIKEIKAGGMAMPRLDIVFSDSFIWEIE